MADIFKSIRIKNGEAISEPVPIGVEDVNVEVTDSNLILKKSEDEKLNLQNTLDIILSSLVWHEN